MERGLDPKKAMKIGKNFTGIKATIASVLERIFYDYKNDKVIERLSEKYENAISPAYIRKIIGSGVIIRMTKSKKNMHYKWNAGVNPDFYDLADKVLAYSTRTPVKIEKKIDLPDYTSKLTILLFKNGVDEGKIPLLTQEIIKIFYPE